ncbi:MAG TPA: VPDSG-CTERM sorting domain-containing protein [Methylomirabilota bacterium]|nr:VPDSG-CTERM sorting domain-containing protein [Methylomirabilota bacterium]
MKAIQTAVSSRRSGLRKLISAGAAMLAVSLFASNASAIQIGGNITFTGGATLNGALSSATSVTSFENVQVLNLDGAYSGFVSVGDAVTMAPSWQFNPSTAVNGLWSVGGFSFDLIASTIEHQSNAGLTISGTGTLSGNGYESTSGLWSFSTQSISSGGVFSFSGATTSTAAVPDSGSTAMLLGLVLISIVTISRFRN